jgi:hypothetical protein
MSAVITNAMSPLTAAEMAAARRGTFTGLIVPKVGRVVGGVRYNNDVVHVNLITGIVLSRLYQRSLDMLDSLNPTAIVLELDRLGRTAGNGDPIRLTDVCKAIADLRASFERSLAGTNKSTNAHVFEPLVVDGQVVRGAKVYRCVAGTGRKCHCRACTGNPKAPVHGQINISGLILGETVVIPAPNGRAPARRSRADVVAKNFIRRKLPVGRYVTYRLDPSDFYCLRAGGAAALAATAGGVTFDADRTAADATLLAG